MLEEQVYQYLYFCTSKSSKASEQQKAALAAMLEEQVCQYLYFCTSKSWIYWYKSTDTDS